MSNKGKYTIEVLDIALDVIEYLMASGQGPQRIAELACQVGIHRNRAFRILKTLEERGYVEVNPETRGYQLGSKFLRSASWCMNNLMWAAWPIAS